MSIHRSLLASVVPLGPLFPIAGALLALVLHSNRTGSLSQIDIKVIVGGACVLGALVGLGGVYTMLAEPRRYWAAGAVGLMSVVISTLIFHLVMTA